MTPPPDHPNIPKSRVGVLLVNLGTPDAPDAPAVKRYLREFLSDRRVVEIPPVVWQPILRGIILNTRPKKSAHAYAQVWTPEGSPLAVHTRNLAEALAGKWGDNVIVDWLAGLARIRVGEQLDLIDKDRFDLCWIVDFPFYEYDEDTKSIDFAHNPFSMPQGGLEALNGQDPLTIKAYQYDMVCNGYEIASGSIRNQHPDLMVKAFELVGLSKQDVEDRFGGLYRAFQYGAPPHGGMAAGVDRIVMLLCGAQNLREITLFPMNQRAEDLLMGAPSPAELKQLRELHIRVVEPSKS